MNWSKFLLLGTVAGLAVFTPLAATSEAQACFFPYRPRLFCRAPVFCHPVVECVSPVIQMPAPVYVQPPQPVVVAPPITKVSLFSPQALVDVQTPFTSVQVQRPVRNFSVYYRQGASGSWQHFGSYALMVRAQRAAAGLQGKGMETSIR
jgi:hypothetical protein